MERPLIRAALEDSELVSINNACVERLLDQDLVQQYDAALRKHVYYILGRRPQSCPPGKLQAMLDEDENTLFLPLASVIDIKKIKELLKNEPDKVEACRAAIDAAEPGTLICRVEDHEQGPESGKDAGPAGRGWACVFRRLLSFCVFVGASTASRGGGASSSSATSDAPSTRRAPAGPLAVETPTAIATGSAALHGRAPRPAEARGRARVAVPAAAWGPRPGRYSTRTPSPRPAPRRHRRATTRAGSSSRTPPGGRRRRHQY